jgi:hypothetical protein
MAFNGLACRATRIAPLKAVVSGVANAPDGAFFPAWTSIPPDVLNLKISLFIRR